MYDLEDLPHFSGFCAGLSMDNRELVNDNGGSYYPIRVRMSLARQREGLSKEILGKMLGVHRTTILRYELGDIRTIDRDRLKDWARICHVPVAWIIKGGPSGDKELDLRANKIGCRMLGYPEPMEFTQ